ncbi:MAG: hypothetical protein KDB23_32535, partial [Planctomycetales bacterium]|nr:hypothetical protein [Planctomycetales bacterium]
MSSAQILQRLVCVTLVFLSASTVSRAEDVDVYLLIGASNMYGTELIENLSEPWLAAQPDVWMWQSPPALWTALSPGYGEGDSNSGAGGDSDRFGPELSLGRTLADAMPDKQIALVKHARGGSDMYVDWNPTGPADNRWNTWIEKTDAALANLVSQGLSYKVAGMFMYQGARDARNLQGVEAESYHDNLPRFIEAARDHFQNDRMPIVMSHLPLFYPDEAYTEKATIRAVQEDLAERDPFISLIDVEGLAIRDRVHFNADGLIELGIRYANELLSMASSNPLLGDFDGDSLLTVSDLDSLTELILSGENVDDFDLNDDALVDAQDREFWLHDLKNTYFGDADLNGEFNSGDLVSVFQTGKYETGTDATWAEGDWNGDVTFSSSDLVLAFQDGGYEQGPRAAVSAVPEPPTG